MPDAIDSMPQERKSRLHKLDKEGLGTRHHKANFLSKIESQSKIASVQGFNRKLLPLGPSSA